MNRLYSFFLINLKTLIVLLLSSCSFFLPEITKEILIGKYAFSDNEYEEMLILKENDQYEYIGRWKSSQLSYSGVWTFAKRGKKNIELIEFRRVKRKYDWPNTPATRVLEPQYSSNGKKIELSHDLDEVMTKNIDSK